MGKLCILIPADTHIPRLGPGFLLKFVGLRTEEDLFPSLGAHLEPMQLDDDIRAVVVRCGDFTGDISLPIDQEVGFAWSFAWLTGHEKLLAVLYLTAGFEGFFPVHLLRVVQSTKTYCNQLPIIPNLWARLNNWFSVSLIWVTHSTKILTECHQSL